MGAVALTKDSFDRQISDGVTLVDFWAAWCAPCKVQLPIVEELAAEMGGTATVAKVNVDEEHALAARYAVSSMPTLMFFKDGREVDRIVGLTSKDVLKGKIREYAGDSQSCGCGHEH